MKTCLVCGAQVDAVFPTCPHCGEASWCDVDVQAIAAQLADVLVRSDAPDERPRVEEQIVAPPRSEFVNPESDTRPETPAARKRKRKR